MKSTMKEKCSLKLVLLLMMFTAVSVLSACGSGGGGGGVAPGPTPSAAKAITAFSFTSPAATGIINENAKTISLTVLNSTDVTTLAATFTTTGASVKVGSTTQVSGTTANNFTSPAVYTVTAADGTTAAYTVTVTPELPWTWVSGVSAFNQNGVYGTKGTASASNVPGSRKSPVSWIDSSGSLWLFGGNGFAATGLTNDFLNDLWKFDHSTGNWTWVSGANAIDQVGSYGTKGTPAATNVPGARFGSVSWIDGSGNLWLFGGRGYISMWLGSLLNDLWKFDPSTANWTWISGANVFSQTGTYGMKGTPAATNVPGARENSVSWIDGSGNLWIFGGYGYDSTSAGTLNDLWKFDPTSGNWTWISGANIVNQPGIYGLKGTADAVNIPGGRQSAVSWIDGNGDLWLFGGAGSGGYLNDLWKFDHSSGYWTWVSGATIVNQAGVYGTKGTASAANAPGARQGSVSWVDSSGNLWLFGGQGYDSASTVAYLNDLWKFDPSSGNWTWVSGENIVNQAGVYGTKGTASTSNVSGSRMEAVSWIDSSGNLWLFGGQSYVGYTTGYRNDLWRVKP